ncbi:MAG: ATP-binding cassette domain-containing protein [Verrucomicrobia bacterium]|nr:ATP-binding cassette domain-containing protein [Verrucomicrobiota bacterium]
MSLPAVECVDLYHEYDGKPALRGVSWKVMPGRICGLLGRNGAGKSTTINILNSFITPVSGACYLLGEESHNLSASVKARIGYLIEGHANTVFSMWIKLNGFMPDFIRAGNLKCTITSSLNWTSVASSESAACLVVSVLKSHSAYCWPKSLI